MSAFSGGAAADTLWQFQDDLARALLDPAADASLPDDLAALVRQPGFAVYRNTTMKGCIDALQANYPAVARIVGEEWFRATAAVYVRADPPTEGTLLRYGAGFERFLVGFEPAAELPYLPGVARLDRFWTEAHIAGDDPVLDADELAAVGVKARAQVALCPHAAARWAWFDAQPIYTIWSRNRAAGQYDDSEIDWHGEGALLVRPHGDVRWIAIDAAACAFLDACSADRPLADALEAARAQDRDLDTDALLTMLVSAGALASATPSRSPNTDRRP